MDNLNQYIKSENEKRNKMPPPSLEEAVESKISMLNQHNDTAASMEFRDRLKARVLEAHAKNNMPRLPFLVSFWNLIKLPRFSVAISAFLLIAVVGGLALNGFLWGGEKSSRLLISPAYAADNFSLVALAGDSAGVTADSAYKLTSKESFSTSAIRSGLSLSPEMDVKVEQTAPKEWVITPSQNLSANSLLRISLAATISENGTETARDFSWAFQVKDNFRVLNTLPGNGGKNVPVKTGIEAVFSHPNLDAYEKHFSISPAVAGSFEYHGRTAVFIPKEPLLHSQLYTVTIDAELGLSGSTNKLGDAKVFTFETELKPGPHSSENVWFGINSGMMQFTPEQVPVIQTYGSTSVPVSVSVYGYASAESFRTALDTRDALPRWSEKWNNYQFDTTNLRRVADFAPKIQTQNYSNFIAFPSPLPIGFYLASISYQDKVTQVLIEVNDLSLIYNIDSSKLLIWANRPGSGKAAAGAEVTVDGSASFKTDANGAAGWDIPPSLQKPDREKPVYITVRSGSDVSINEISFGLPADPGRWSYFYTDRPRYQTDDTLSFFAMARSRADSGVPSGKYSVVLSRSGWYDYYYNPVKIAEVEVTPDSYGTVTGQIPLKGLRPDSYSVALMLDGKQLISSYVNVLPYVKPAYSISVTPSVANAFAGDQVNFTAKASFFDGTPAPGIKMRVTKGHNGTELGNFTTDEAGEIKFSDTTAYNSQTYWPQTSYYQVTPVSAEITDLSASTNVTWYGPAYYSRSEVKYPEKGKAEIILKVRKVDLNRINNPSANAGWDEEWLGTEPVAGAAINGTITRKTWVKIETGTAYDFINKLSYKTYRYDQREEKVADVSLTSGADGTARYSLAVAPEGSYYLSYKIADPAGRTVEGSAYAYYYDGQIYYGDYYGAGGDQVTIQFNRDDRMYSLGDSVKATLAAGGKSVSGGGTNRFLFAKYQQGLKSWQVQNGSDYTFAFSAADIPNVQIFAAWWDGKKYHTARTDGWWGYNDGGAKYNYRDRELTVGVSLDKSEYRPGGEVKAQITVKDKNGSPVAAAVNLNLVDESYYAIASDNASPLTMIYSLLYSGIISSMETQTAMPTGLSSGGAERGACFTAGTLVAMADGTQKPIEKVKVGDQVATLLNPLGTQKVAGTVSAVFEHAGNKLVSINNGLLTATAEHMIYASGTFKPAGEIKTGDILIGMDGKKIVVTSTEIIFKRVPVYNLRVDPYHTFIANGIYVHNDKDGALRQNFVDVALFRTVETGKDGRAEVSFKLPDNVTTWRVTSQAISGNISAGVALSKIKATLPAFVDVSVGKEYLVGDQVIAKLRTFGTALNKTDAVNYSVESPGLNNFSFKTAGKAYAPTEVSLPTLPLGSYDVTYYMDSAKGNDAVKLPVTAVTSHLAAQKILSASDVVPGMAFSAPGAQGPVRIVFADASANRFYQLLRSLGWSWGKRVDQSLAKAVASDMLAKYYDENGFESGFDGNMYQQADGGIGLLPYAGSDLDLTARLAALAPDKFDEGAMRQYFLRALEEKKATPETVTDALLGLASLGDPVLPRLQLWKTRTDLSVDSRMRVALALMKMGASEDARAIYNGVISSAEARGEYAVMTGENENVTLLRTAFMAELAAGLNMPERDKLWAYVEDHDYGSARWDEKDVEVLSNLEELAFAIYSLPHLSPGPSSVGYELNGAKGEIDLNGWSQRTINVALGDLPEFKITAVKGKASVVVIGSVPLSQVGYAPKSEVTVSRTYLVNGQPTTSFHDNDLVQVVLDVAIARSSPSRNFQITDALPGGLVAASEAYNPYSGYSYSWTNPFEVTSEKITWNVWKGGDPDRNGIYHMTLRYFARAKTKGTYKAEGSLIQGFQDPTAINFSPTQTVTIQ